MNAIRSLSPGLRKPALRRIGTGADAAPASDIEKQPGAVTPAAASKPPPMKSRRENCIFMFLSFCYFAAPSTRVKSILSTHTALMEDLPSFPNRPGPIQKYSCSFGVHVQTSYQA